LIFQARLTVDLGAFLIGSSVVKEQYGARRESRGARSVRSNSQTRLAVDTGSPIIGAKNCPD
jgi:hypothetical protein